MKPIIVKLKSYVGDDTFMNVFPDPLYMVVDADTGEELDNGYKSREEALKKWGDKMKWSIISLSKDDIKQALLDADDIVPPEVEKFIDELPDKTMKW